MVTDYACDYGLQVPGVTVSYLYQLYHITFASVPGGVNKYFTVRQWVVPFHTRYQQVCNFIDWFSSVPGGCGSPS